MNFQPANQTGAPKATFGAGPGRKALESAGRQQKAEDKEFGVADALSLSESVTVSAAPEKVWDLVADITRMGDWSPETTSASWVGGDGPAVGAKFKGSNKRGFMKWSTTCEVLAADRGSKFSFLRPSGIDDGTEWSFTMQAKDGATVLTESAQQRRAPGGMARLAGRVMFGSDREAQVRQGMRTTIERIKAAAEAGS